MPRNVKVFDGGIVQVPITALMRRNLVMVMQKHPNFYITDAARWLMEEGMKAFAKSEERSIDDVRIDTSTDANKPERPAFFAS